MTQTLAILFATTMAGVPALQAQDSAGRHRIGTESVVAALEAHGLPSAGLTITLAAPVDASVKDPALSLISVTAEGQENAKLLVACRNRIECRPFYASARWTSGVAIGSLLAASSTAANGTARKQVDPVSGIGSTLKAGSWTTLELDGERLHIRLKVVCLQAGKIGDKIQVSTADRKQTFTVEVVDLGLTKARI